MTSRKSKNKKTHVKKAKIKTFISRHFAWILCVASILVCLTFFLSESSKTKYQTALTSIRLEKLFKQALPLSMGERIAFWSDNLLKDPEILSPLGTGPSINDSSPLFANPFDCTTFVETVGALSRSDFSVELSSQLIAIRYKNGIVGFQTRNHFPEADWLPNNRSVGILNDLTMQIAKQRGVLVSFAHKEIHKSEWMFEHSPEGYGRALASQGMDHIQVDVPYIPLQKMIYILKKIPQGALINIVREDAKNHPVLISHQGFLIWKQNKAYFLHVNSNHKTMERPFLDYLHSLARSSHWKVVGLNIAAFNG